MVTEKQCTKCLIIKKHTDFHKNIKFNDGLEYWCKICWAEYRKSYRFKNLKSHQYKNNMHRAERIKWFQNLKSNVPCKDCGKIYEPFCMDYDHIPEKGKKIKSISRMVIDNASKNTILNEIKKCDLVCILCHNKRTYDRLNAKLGDYRKYKPHHQRNITIINIFKNKNCYICNHKYENYNMQLDHKDPKDKLYNICQLKSYKLDTLFLEIAKCQTICALCHRRKSITEQKDNKYKLNRKKPNKRIKLYFNSLNNKKECGICHQIKNSNEFNKNKNKLHTYCCECFNAYKRSRRKFYSK